MTTSTITDGPHPESEVSHGYVLNHGKWTEDDYGEEPTFPASGNGGIWSSVEELARYEQAIQRATFLSPASIIDSRTVKSFPNWNSTTPPVIGWSWFIENNRNGFKTIGHTGSQGGFLCNYVTIPESKVFFAILCNTPRDVNAYTEKIEQWLMTTGAINASK
jgi:CubicO group peptidase (beta-lactamase class C family)